MYNDRPCWVGIDVGKGGAISAIWSDGMVLSHVTPVLSSGDIDVLTMYTIISNLSHVKMVVIEQVHAIFGSSAGSTFEFGRSSGIAEGVVCVSRLPYTMVPPKTWQKEMWRGVEKIKKSGKNTTDTKATSLVAVQRLFPNATLYDKSKPKSKKIHDGIVDSILLAEYGRRLWNGLKE